MKATLGTIALAALLCSCNAPDPSATDDATVGTPPPGDQRQASDQPTPPGAPPDADGVAVAVEVPERFRGDWAASAEACTQPGEVTRLHIGDDEIRFHESEGPILSLVERGNQLTLLARLTGEGETRDASYAFTLSADGSELRDGNGFTRQRCD